MFIIQNFLNKNIKTSKKFKKLHMNSEKSMNSFKMKKGYLIIYWKIFFFFYEQSVPPTSQNTFDYD